MGVDMQKKFYLRNMNGIKKPDSQDKATRAQCKNIEDTPLYVAVITYLGYGLISLFGWLHDILRFLKLEKNCGHSDKNKDFVPLYRSYEHFYARNLYQRARNIFNRPICTVPGAVVGIKERIFTRFNWSMKYSGKVIEAINMASYNYLGFAENTGCCTESVIDCIEKNGVACALSRVELGTHPTQRKLEKLMAEFLRVEDCITFGMGFATNSTNIPTLASKGCLILSDEFNHASLVLGSRLSGATIQTFAHNDMNSLEKRLRDSIVDGQPRSHHPWKKIIIVVEGVYSMEGTICNLPEIIRLKKKYKAYLYLDEAHSIGAMGRNGGGIVDYYGCDPNDVDVLMGTFTKSFAAAGGYIAGSKSVIDHIRRNSHANLYSVAMAPAICEQIFMSLSVIMGKINPGEGERRLKSLADNAHYFRRKLIEMGFIVYGSDDSPIVPLLIFLPAKLCFFNMEMLKRKVAVVSVGFPATRLLESRVRFCLSASHTRKMLDETLKAIDELDHLVQIRYSSRNPPKRFSELTRS